MNKFKLTCLASMIFAPAVHAATVYVSNTSAGACVPSADVTCGGYFNPYKNLRDAINGANSGDDIVVWGTAANKPYYFYDQGTPQSCVGQSIMNLSKFNSPSLKTTIRIPAGNSYKPIIRGTLVYGSSNWTLLSQNSNGYLYKMPWALTQCGGSSTPQEPEQVFRDALPDGQRQLHQVGGTVFSGYYPGADPSTLNPDWVAGINQSGNLWPGYISFVSLESLTANQFYYDRKAKVLYIRLGSTLAAGEGIEVSATQFLASGSGMANVTLQNLVFERSNTSYYWRGGAALLSGSGIIVDSVDFRDSDSHCLQIEGNNNQVINSTFNRCGQVGLVANGAGNTINNNYFYANNSFRNFNFNWEAGPTKFIGNNGLTNSTISNNVIAANNGHGIWLDTHNNGNTISNNVSAYNVIGIFLENSSSANIDSNVIFGNKAQAIQFRGSPNSIINNNLMVGNAQDGVFIQPASAGESAYASTNVRVSNNTMAWHDEATNKKPVWVTPSTTLYGNTYCGTATGDGSLHFWLQDWAAGPGNVFNWSNWLSAKTSGSYTAPAYDANATYPSYMKIASQPSAVQAWQTTPNMGLIAYPSGISTTRASVQKLVTDNCH
jgi:parallel beta-helix repeat protein